MLEPVVVVRTKVTGGVVRLGVAPRRVLDFVPLGTAGVDRVYDRDGLPLFERAVYPRAGVRFFADVQGAGRDGALRPVVAVQFDVTRADEGVFVPVQVGLRFGPHLDVEHVVEGIRVIRVIDFFLGHFLFADVADPPGDVDAVPVGAVAIDDRMQFAFQNDGEGDELTRRVVVHGDVL